MTNTTVGRRPVQIVELRQPICANTYGVSPCTASGGADAKCFNCRAGCQDETNFRYVPEDPLAADRVYGQRDTLDQADFTRSADLFFALKASIPASPSGVLWELGNATTAIYLGFTGSNLVFRAGGGTSTRYNLLTYTEQLDNSAWTKANLSVTANSVANPLNGAVTADKIVENSATSIHTAFQSISVVSGTDYRFSIYAKAAERSGIRLHVQSSMFGVACFVDFLDGAVEQVGNATGSVEAVADGWYRFSMSPTPSATATTTGNFTVYMLNDAGNATYAGDGSSGIHVFGAQAEATHLREYQSVADAATFDTGAPPDDCAAIKVASSEVAGQMLTLYGEIDISANSVSLWRWDQRERTLASFGSVTANSSFSSWAAGTNGGVGVVSGATASGEDATDFKGTIHEFKVYDSQAAPDMTAGFVLPLYFSNGRIAEKGGQYGLPHVIPSLDGASTSPARISLGGSSVDAQGIGIRATCSLTFTDHPHTDRLVDPYLSGRTYDPMTRGSFWTKWLSRNRYRQNVILRLYEGYEGEALSSMVTRQYFLQSVTPPGDGGSVTIQGADVLVRAQARRAQLPLASFGKLYGDLTATALSFECDGAEVTDYGSSGTLRIDDELMTYSAVAASANGITFTISARGTDGTTAAAHDTETVVQECRRYTKQRVDSVLKDILTYGGVDEGYLDLAGWESEADEYLTAYLLTTVITEPTSVQDLVNELVEQCQIYVWWDERARKVKMKAVRGVNSEPETLSAENNIMRGIGFSEEPRERVTQVWFHYGLRDYTQSLTDPQNYDFRNVTADLPAETQEQYGEPSVKQVFSRWVRAATLADTSASKIVSRYRDTPRRIRFDMDAKDRGYWLGDQFRLSHYLDVDDYGERQTKRWTIIEAEEVEPGHRVSYLAEDTTLYGQIYYIQASGAADFPGAVSAAFGAAYIGNSSGALSDGTDSARVN